jgi:hypothetical protein
MFNLSSSVTSSSGSFHRNYSQAITQNQPSEQNPILEDMMVIMKKMSASIDKAEADRVQDKKDIATLIGQTKTEVKSYTDNSISDNNLRFAHCIANACVEIASAPDKQRVGAIFNEQFQRYGIASINQFKYSIGEMTSAAHASVSNEIQLLENQQQQHPNHSQQQQQQQQLPNHSQQQQQQQQQFIIPPQQQQQFQPPIFGLQPNGPITTGYQQFLNMASSHNPSLTQKQTPQQTLANPTLNKFSSIMPIFQNNA